MSTRSIIVVTGVDNYNRPNTVRLYKHSDGYPSHTLDVIYHAIEDGENAIKKNKERFKDSSLQMHTDLLVGKLVGHGTSEYGRGVHIEHETSNPLKASDLGGQWDLEYIYVINTQTKTITIYGGGFKNTSPGGHIKSGPLTEEAVLGQDEKDVRDLMDKIRSLGFKFIHKEEKPLGKKRSSKKEEKEEVSSEFIKAKLKSHLQEMGIRVEGNYVRKADLEKVLADMPWDNPKADEAVKQYYSKQHRRTELQRYIKSHEFRYKTGSLIVSVESYLTDVDDCPNDKSMAQVYKSGIKTMLDEAKEVKKLGKEWSVLDEQHTDQLLEDK